MSGLKLSHYYPNAEWAYSSDGDYSTLVWFGPGEKPTEAEIDALSWPPPPPTVTEVEEAVTRVVDEMLDGEDEKLVALALGVVDLVIAARDGQLDGRSKTQVRSAFRDRIKETLRTRRGG